jgi:hypothetical protein
MTNRQFTINLIELLSVYGVPPRGVRPHDGTPVAAMSAIAAFPALWVVLFCVAPT